MVVTLAVVGDIIPPRDRGRYQGFFGGVFGVSTVDRAAPRRLLRRPALLALDLLRQPADRRRRARRDRRCVPCPHRASRACDRLPRAPCCSPGHCPRSSSSRASAGRRGRGARGRSCRWSSLAVVLLPAFVLAERRAQRADPAALALPQPHVCGHERDRLHHRPRPLRRGHLPPALPADHEGVEPHELRPAADAADGRACS